MSQGHRFTKLTGTNIQYCLGCGHVPLKNWISQTVNKLGCDYKQHPTYKAWLKNPGSFPTKE